MKLALNEETPTGIPLEDWVKCYLTDRLINVIDALKYLNKQNVADITRYMKAYSDYIDAKGRLDGFQEGLWHVLDLASLHHLFDGFEDPKLTSPQALEVWNNSWWMKWKRDQEKYKGMTPVKK